MKKTTSAQPTFVEFAAATPSVPITPTELFITAVDQYLDFSDRERAPDHGLTVAETKPVHDAIMRGYEELGMAAADAAYQARVKAWKARTGRNPFSGLPVRR